MAHLRRGIIPAMGMRGAKSKLTPELETQFCRWIETVGFVTVAAGQVGLSCETVYRWRKIGMAASSGKYRHFYDSMTRARATYAARLAGTLNQCATGAVVYLPVRDKDGNPVRDENDEIVTAPKVMMPDARLMMYLADRLIPREDDEPATVMVTQTRVALESEQARHIDLMSAALVGLQRLGVPIPRLEPPVIETTAQKAPEPVDDGEN